MDIIRFVNPGSGFLLGQGMIVPHLDSKTWVERYKDIGECTLVSRHVPLMQQLLPIGTIISHVNTSELMIVSKHDIVRDDGTQPSITITGYSLVDLLRYRYVGSFQGQTSLSRTPYTIGPYTNAVAAVQLIDDHAIFNGNSADPKYIPPIPQSIVMSGIPVPNNYDAYDFTVGDGTVWDRAREILDSEDLGIKVIRPGPLSISKDTVIFWVHAGVDRSSTVEFSYTDDNFGHAESYESDETDFTYAHVTSTWFRLNVSLGGSSGVKARVIQLDAAFLDEQFDVEPTGNAAIYVLAVMQFLGEQLIKRSRKTRIATLASEDKHPKYRYRAHYNIGDIVSIIPPSGQVEKKRVTEYVEIDDAEGSSEYPTFSYYE